MAPQKKNPKVLPPNFFDQPQSQQNAGGSNPSVLPPNFFDSADSESASSATSRPSAVPQQMLDRLRANINSRAGGMNYDASSIPTPATNDSGIVPAGIRVIKSIASLPGTILNAPQTPDEQAVFDAGHTNPINAQQALAVYRLGVKPSMDAVDKANLYDLKQQAAPETASDTFSPGHMANAYRVASVIPGVGPLVGNLVERAAGGDVTGALTEGAAYRGIGNAVERAPGFIASKVNPTPESRLTFAAGPDSLPDVKGAMPQLEKTPYTGGGVLDMLDRAAQRIRGQIQGYLNKPMNQAPVGARQLPPASIEVPTGNSFDGSGSSVATTPAQARPIVNAAGEPLAGSSPREIDAGLGQQNAASQLGSAASTVPRSVLGEPNPITSQIGPQAAAVPQSVFAGKTTPGTQFLTAGEDAAAAGNAVGNPGTVKINLTAENLPRLQRVAEGLREQLKNPAGRTDAEIAATQSKLQEIESALKQSPAAPTRVGDSTVPGSIFSDEITKYLSQHPELGKVNPGIVDAMISKAMELKGQTFTLDELNNLRKSGGAANSGYYSKSALDQIIESMKPADQRVVSRIIENTSRRALYDQLGRLNGVDPQAIAEMQRQHGGVMQTRQAISDRLAGLDGRAAYQSGQGLALNAMKSEGGVVETAKRSVGPAVTRAEASRVRNSDVAFKPVGQAPPAGAFASLLSALANQNNRKAK